MTCPDMTLMIRLVDKDIETVILTVFCMCKTGKWMSMLRRDTDAIKTDLNRTELLEIKNTMSAIKTCMMATADETLQSEILINLKAWQ